MKHLKVLVKWNWWWNFACVSTKSLNFQIYFLSFPWEIIFRCYFSQLFMYLALKNVEMTVKYLKLLWYRFLSTKTWNCSIFYRISSWFVSVKLCWSHSSISQATFSFLVMISHVIRVDFLRQDWCVVIVNLLSSRGHKNSSSRSLVEQAFILTVILFLQLFSLHR